MAVFAFLLLSCVNYSFFVSFKLFTPVEAVDRGQCADFENSIPVLSTTENEFSGCANKAELNFLETREVEHDVAGAVWVKWREVWQAGVRCAKADWPLSTLKARPTLDENVHVVIFFPKTRTYSWADVQHVLPITEFPQPIAYESHNIGEKLVNDLAVAHRYIMQKLSVSVLNVIDNLHIEAMIESARDVTVWKKISGEIAHSKSYPDLGRVLLQLQNMILQRYLNNDWLRHSLFSWQQQCQSARSAESIELAKEELNDSILWVEVHSLPDVPLQSAWSSEWKACMHEVMKMFLFSNATPEIVGVKNISCTNISKSTLQVCQKRPKLEVRRAEAQACDAENCSHQQVEMENRPGSCYGHNTGRTAPPSDFCKDKNSTERGPSPDSPMTGENKQVAVAVCQGNLDISQNEDAESTPLNFGSMEKKSLSYGNKNRQCVAFIEAKQRQCVRWANDGDIYCCVHLASRFTGRSSKSEVTLRKESSLCEGTTVLGSRCKHRSLVGSPFCKKHRPNDDTNMCMKLPERNMKRTHEDMINTDLGQNCKDMILFGEMDTPLQVEPVSIMGGELVDKPGYSGRELNNLKMPRCIGLSPFNRSNFCQEFAKRYLLYCEKHLPSWLKRARNGKSRIISKDVFLDLLRDCYTREQRLCLHQACELFYRIFKSILSRRNPIPKEIQLQWAVSEAAKDMKVGEILMKLVSMEKERLMSLWGFTDEVNVCSSPEMETPRALPEAIDSVVDSPNPIICNLCSKEFQDNQTLGTHWIESHRKEAQWLFRGYACAICLDSFTNKKVLEAHVHDRHHSEFFDNCMLFRCIPCGCHFGDDKKLWLHVQSVHHTNLSPSDVPWSHKILPGKNPPVKSEVSSLGPTEKNSGSRVSARKFICRFCGLKFDLLPDLGRHHQALHMGPNINGSNSQKKGIQLHAYKLKSGRLSRPRFARCGIGSASYRIRNRGSSVVKENAIQLWNSSGVKTAQQPLQVLEVPGDLGWISQNQCSTIAKVLFSEIQKTKSPPDSDDILCFAQTSCCRLSLKKSLEDIYGELPENLYLRAAKLCSENNIQVRWHQDGFVCPKGCKPAPEMNGLLPPMSLSHDFTHIKSEFPKEYEADEWEVDEGHCVLNSSHLGQMFSQDVMILCEDISFGKEKLPITCVGNKDLFKSANTPSDGNSDSATRFSRPWESFTYVLKSPVFQSLASESMSEQLGCVCGNSGCSPEVCDHVHIFNNDNDDAKDIYGKSIRGRFPYDVEGRIILEGEYSINECNSSCSCDSMCQNRVLQNGMTVRLELFLTEKKGWGVRAAETIYRGTFVCEYIGEIIDQPEAKKRQNSYNVGDCSYLYKVNSPNEEGPPYSMDATIYGNVSRFINHSCSPNLKARHVTVESTERHLTHVGLYAARDISRGEELTHDCRYEADPGEARPCHCGEFGCRGSLH